MTESVMWRGAVQVCERRDGHTCLLADHFPKQERKECGATCYERPPSFSLFNSVVGHSIDKYLLSAPSAVASGAAHFPEGS